MAPPKRSLKPHIRRQLRDAALAANPTRDPAQDFTVLGYEATLIKGKGKERAEMLMAWDGVRPAGMMEEIMVDRHDILHLLKTLPDGLSSNAAPPSPTPSTAFSDLPSDAEDTFFFSSDEAEDYQRGKKRRRIEVGREERLRAKEAEGVKEMEEREREKAVKEEERLMAEQAERDLQAEKPPAELLHTMRHTLTSLLSSPNPQILELRILTHHGADPRFAFLRADGRWRGYWEGMKADAAGGGKGKQVEKERDQSKEVKVVGMGGLMGAYADSDEDSDEDGVGVGMEGEEVEVGSATTPEVPLQPPLPPAEDLPPPGAEILPPPPDESPSDPPKVSDSPTTASDEAKAARRAKAKEWAEKRRAEGGGGGS